MGSHPTLPPLEDKLNSNYQMVDVTEKSATFRRAQARGVIRMAQKTLELVCQKKLPKGDALALAEASAIIATKQTSTLLPLCHPIPIEKVTVKCIPLEKENAIEVVCEVATTAKTGVEMEALVGTQAALLCLYDLIKMVDPELNIEGVRLNFKEGGKKGLWQHPEHQEVSKVSAEKKNAHFSAQKLDSVSVAVVIASDRVSKKEAQDLSGPCAQEWFLKRGANVSPLTVVPDEKEKLSAAVIEAVEKKISLLLISGGTGLGPRDITVSTLLSLGAKEMKGIGELLRKEGGQLKKTAWLSNSGGFILNQTLILALPGSPKAVSEGLNTLEAILPHALHVLIGGDHA